MFTGIIKEVGRVADASRRSGGLRLRVSHGGAEAFADLAIDESVSINGACQTVVACDAHSFEVDTVEETLQKTTLGALQSGSLVNLERAVRPMDRLGGHFVLGHVDCASPVTAIRELGASREISVALPEEFAGWIVPAGSITIDGVSLTVARLDEAALTVAVIPFTFAHTTINALRVGTTVNLEFDILGKYVARSLGFSGGAALAESSKIDEAWLRGQGFS